MNRDSIRIIVADDHFVVREGLRSLLGREPDLVVVGEASNGAEVVEAFLRLKPDLVLMDLRMPVLGGVDAIAEIRRHAPGARILALSSLDGDETIHVALGSGAMGYILKEDSGDQVVPAIRAVMAGQRWLPPAIKRRLAHRDRSETISTREKEVLQLLSLGEANKEIAVRLGIGEGTVKTHVKSILGKLQARDRTEAVMVAIRRGIIQLDNPDKG